MAVMHPSYPIWGDERSREQEMYESLRKLPDDFHIFYSFKIRTINGDYKRIGYSLDREVKECEVDFIVFNRAKGIVVIEAKNGNVRFTDGQWCYGDGTPMRDPFKQADRCKWRIDELLKNRVPNGYDIAERLRIHTAVWFPSITRSDLQSKKLPSDALRDFILTCDDLDNPSAQIEKIFTYMTSGDGGHNQTNVAAQEIEQIFANVFCPTFEICESMSSKIGRQKKFYNKLLDEQVAILNYLEEQQIAAISGVAGTGKTMIAIRKAMGHAINGERVLFLCFNRNLKEFLQQSQGHNNIDYYTIDGFATKIVGGSDYKLLSKHLEEKFETFEYSHIIVDEGQDLGGIGATAVLKSLESIVKVHDDKTFYLFYDKYQCVQGKGSKEANEFMGFVAQMDCRLTLYKNCRNTVSIAKTSCAPLDIKPLLKEGSIDGNVSQIQFIKEGETLDALERILPKLIDSYGASEIVILTPCTEQGSSLYSKVTRSDGAYWLKTNKGEIEFTTCRKFKGLERDCVILIDVNKKTLVDEMKDGSVSDLNPMLFYVGASRARFELRIIANIAQDEVPQILQALGEQRSSNYKRLAAALYSIISE